MKQALSLEPDDGYYIDSLGWVYFQKGLFAEAARELERAHELVPDDPIITEHLGDAYERLGDFDRAMDLYRRALELDPPDDHRDALHRKLEILEAAHQPR